MVRNEKILFSNSPKRQELEKVSWKQAASVGSRKAGCAQLVVVLAVLGWHLFSFHLWYYMACSLCLQSYWLRVHPNAVCKDPNSKYSQIHRSWGLKTGIWGVGGCGVTVQHITAPWLWALQCLSEIHKSSFFLMSLILIVLILTIFFLSFIFQRKWAGLSIGQEIDGRYFFLAT